MAVAKHAVRKAHRAAFQQLGRAEDGDQAGGYLVADGNAVAAVSLTCREQAKEMLNFVHEHQKVAPAWNEERAFTVEVAPRTNREHLCCREARPANYDKVLPKRVTARYRHKTLAARCHGCDAALLTITENEHKYVSVQRCELDSLVRNIDIPCLMGGLLHPKSRTQHCYCYCNKKKKVSRSRAHPRKQIGPEIRHGLQPYE
mmetsp:Transcript_17732/g.29589  ORF Transcript_17732/g.29589 Transcript_17732/m.29589 type:complete len:202 (-) Transcript_17732:175-780(-)